MTPPVTVAEIRAHMKSGDCMCAYTEPVLEVLDRLEAELAEERKTRAELGHLIGALARAGGVPT